MSLWCGFVIRNTPLFHINRSITNNKKNSMADLDQDFLDFVVKALVDHPDDVQVERTVDEMGVLLTLKTNPEDMLQKMKIMKAGIMYTNMACLGSFIVIFCCTNMDPAMSNGRT